MKTAELFRRLDEWRLGFLRCSGHRLRQAADQGLAVEFSDIIVEARFAATLEIIIRRTTGKGNHGDVLPTGIAPDILGELEPVHAGHFDVADDDVKGRPLLAHLQGLGRRFSGDDDPTGDRQQRRQKVAEEGAVIDQQRPAGAIGILEGALRGGTEPVGEALGQEITGIRRKLHLPHSQRGKPFAGGYGRADRHRTRSGDPRRDLSPQGGRRG